MKRKIAVLVLALALALGVLAGCGSSGSGDSSNNPANNTASDSNSSTGEKINAQIILVDKDEAEYSYDINVTDGATLREALYEAELITKDTYEAMFVEDIDGHVASVLVDGVTWLPCDADGNQLGGLFDDITVKDGDVIKLVYYVVPEMD